jgi:hypothetical protein
MIFQKFILSFYIYTYEKISKKSNQRLILLIIIVDSAVVFRIKSLNINVFHIFWI